MYRCKCVTTHTGVHYVAGQSILLKWAAPMSPIGSMKPWTNIYNGNPRSDPKVRLQDTFPKQSICTILVNPVNPCLENSTLALPEVFIDFMTPPHEMVQEFRVFGKLDPSNSDNGKKEFDKLQILGVYCMFFRSFLIWEINEKKNGRQMTWLGF